MAGKRYYITTLGDWRRHAARFANSHWLALNDCPHSNTGNAAPGGRAATQCGATSPSAPINDVAAPSVNDSTRVLVLVEADEGAHLALEDDAAFEALPHPLSQKPISDAAQTALAAHGVAPGATTFDAAEALARVHPLLRHRVF